MNWTDHIVAVLTKVGPAHDQLRAAIETAQEWARTTSKTRSQLWDTKLFKQEKS